MTLHPCHRSSDTLIIDLFTYGENETAYDRRITLEFQVDTVLPVVPGDLRLQAFDLGVIRLCHIK